MKEGSKHTYLPLVAFAFALASLESRKLLKIVPC